MSGSYGGGGGGSRYGRGRGGSGGGSGSRYGRGRGGSGGGGSSNRGGGGGYEGGYGGDLGGGGSRGGGRDGDWVCANSRAPSTAGGGGRNYDGNRGGGRSGSGGRGGSLDGDWVCPNSSCGNVNFTRTTKCNKCGVPSPAGGGGSGSGYASRGGGGYNSGRSGNYGGGGGRNYDWNPGGRSRSYGGRGGIGQEVKNPSLEDSHFISLPLAIHPDLVDKLQNFQNAILGCSASGQDGFEDTPDVKLGVVNKKKHVKVKSDTTDTNSNAELGIDKSIFIKPTTFHLTVLMLKLWNKDRIAAATEVLQNISSQVNDALDNRPVFIALKGLECMQGSPSKACIVYAPVEEIGGECRLLRACEVIIKAYVEAGIVLEKDIRRKLKLHATLMNARHRKGKETLGHDSFDASGIFLRYGSEKWGDYLIREAHLSQRFVYDESGYYHCCASIPFPESMQVE